MESRELDTTWGCVGGRGTDFGGGKLLLQMKQFHTLYTNYSIFSLTGLLFELKQRNWLKGSENRPGKEKPLKWGALWGYSGAEVDLRAAKLSPRRGYFCVASTAFPPQKQASGEATLPFLKLLYFWKVTIRPDSSLPRRYLLTAEKVTYLLDTYLPAG